MLTLHVMLSYLNANVSSLNHHKKMKAEPSQLIPQKLTEKKPKAFNCYNKC